MHLQGLRLQRVRGEFVARELVSDSGRFSGEFFGDVSVAVPRTAAIGPTAFSGSTVLLRPELRVIARERISWESRAGGSSESAGARSTGLREAQLSSGVPARSRRYPVGAVPPKAWNQGLDALIGHAELLVDRVVAGECRIGGLSHLEHVDDVVVFEELEETSELIARGALPSVVKITFLTPHLEPGPRLLHQPDGQARLFGQFPLISAGMGQRSRFWPDLPSGWLLLAGSAAVSQSGDDEPHRSRPGAHQLLVEGERKPGASRVPHLTRKR